MSWRQPTCWMVWAIVAIATPPLPAEDGPENPPPADEDRAQPLQERDALWDAAQKLRGEGKLAEALAPAEKMLALEERLFGSDDAELAVSWNWLAALHVEREDWAAARKAYQAALAIFEQHYAEGHWEIIDARLARADVDLLEKLSSTQRKQLQAAEHLMTKSQTLAEQNEHKEALPMAQGAVAIRREVLGTDHWLTSESEHWISYLANATGDLTEARRAGQQAVETRQNVLGPRHPQLGPSLNNLAFTYESSRESKDLERATELYRQALEIYLELPGYKSDQLATLGNLARLYERRDQIAQALPLIEQIVEIQQRQMKPDDPGYLASLEWLKRSRISECDRLLKEAKKLHGEGKVAEALIEAEKMLLVEQQLYGNDRTEIADSRAAIADWHLQLDDFAGARNDWAEALRIRTLVLGAEHWQTIDARLGHEHVGILESLNPGQRRQLQHADLLFLEAIERAGHSQPKEALKLFKQVAKVRQSILGEKNAETARSLNNLGFLLREMGDNTEAKRYYEQALSINKEILGERHPDTATLLNNLGLLLSETGDYPAALPFLERAHAIRKEVLGEKHPDYAASLNNLGLLFVSMRRYSEAKSHYEQALAIHKEVRGEKHPDTAVTLNNLGNLFYEMGDYASARPYYEQALSINTEVLGERHLQTARSFSNLGLLLVLIGDFGSARSSLEQALAIRLEVLGKQHHYTADSLNNLGGVLYEIGDYVSARPYYEESLAIRKDILGEKHPDTAVTLGNLGTLLQAMGDYTSAQPYLEQALAIHVEVCGKKHAHTATALNNLGLLLDVMGDYPSARQYYEEALGISNEVLGEKHPHSAAALSNLSSLAAATDRFDDALAHMTQAIAIRQACLEQVFALSSEPAMEKYLATVSGDLPWLLTLSASRPAAAEASHTTLAWTLRRKAMVFEAMQQFRQSEVLAAHDPEFAEQRFELRALEQQLTHWALHPPRMEAAALAAARQEKQAEIERLQASLKRRLAEYRGESQPVEVTVEHVRARLPAKGALVELVKYAPYRFKAKGKEPRWDPERYVAFVLLSDAEAPVRMIDLGEAEEIDALVADLAKQMQYAREWHTGSGTLDDDESNLEEAYRETAGELHRLTWQKLEPALGEETTRVYLSPDSQLHQVAWESLVDRQDKYLLEGNREIVYLSSGRDLLKVEAKTHGAGTYVFAGPDFGLPAAERQKLAERLLKDLPVAVKPATPPPATMLAITDTTGQRRVVRGLSAEVRGAGRFEPLPGAAAEAADVERLLDRNAHFGPVKTYAAQAALEEVVKAMPVPRVLVINSHGFFFPDQPQRREERLEMSGFAGGSELGAARGQLLLQAQENPLLRSGLVLSGANRLMAAEDQEVAVDDGWLTAQEIAQLDLRGTQLVVLSACESGRGTIKTGEAVSGMRQAFVLAGAETLLATLYSVPDEETRQLMETFYLGLESGQGKLAALNKARRQVIAARRAKGKAAHPFFWASFVLVGMPN